MLLLTVGFPLLRLVRPNPTRFLTATTYLPFSTLPHKEKPIHKSKITSAAPKGTPLRGVNFLRDGKDPEALEDDEYPQWLWDLLDEDNQLSLRENPALKTNQRSLNRANIRADNFMRGKKN